MRAIIKECEVKINDICNKLRPLKDSYGRIFIKKKKNCNKLNIKFYCWIKSYEFLVCK